MRVRSMLLSACGIAAGTVLWLWFWHMVPCDPRESSAAIRMGIASAALLPGVAVLAAMIVVQIAARFASGAVDPTLGRDGRLLLLNQRAISNSVEQMVVFAPALLALSAACEAGAMPKVVALGLTFGAARLAFWFGYLIAPILRAPGMAATGTVGLVTLAAALWVWLTATFP